MSLDNANSRRNWEHTSQPGLVTISGIQYRISRAPDGSICCPVPACPGTFNRRSAFKTHLKTSPSLLLSLYLFLLSSFLLSRSSISPSTPRLSSPTSTSCVPLFSLHPPFHISTSSSLLSLSIFFSILFSSLSYSLPVLPQAPLPLPPPSLQPSLDEFQLDPSPSFSLSSIYLLPYPSFPQAISRVVLNPGQDYLLSTPLLDQLGLSFHTALNIFICIACKKSLTAAMVSGHRKAHHNQSLDKIQLQSLDQFVLQYNVYRRQEEVNIPAHAGPPVQLIAPPRPGFLCTQSLDCHYAACTITTMINHGRLVHKASSNAMTYDHALVQQLFESVGRVYFVVLQPPPSHQPITIRDALSHSFLPSLDLLLVPSSPLPDEERRSLIKVMAWDRFMPDVRSNRSDVKFLDALKARHTEDEFLGFFVALDSLVKAYFAIAPDLLEGNPHSFTICKLILHGDNVTKDSDYWRPVSKKNTLYSDLLLQFLRAILRLYLSQHNPSNFSFGLHPNQTQALHAFASTINRPDPPPVP
ncbi:uncharacterized protein EDB91DRAFT_1265497 [Suillus paluster]|nr:uncharacterized protein EDB91DRAFT_1265497 [Suillus paluster]KAG1725720.1 hypothetical protein EDB91DRAFT_1265497 [Suillus paluster]